MKLPLLDGVLLDGLRARLDPEILTEAVAQAARQIRHRQAGPDERRALEQELRRVEGRIAGLLDAFATRRATEAVYTELERAECQKKALWARLDAVAGLDRLAAVDPARLQQDLARRAQDLQGLLGRHVPQTGNYCGS